MVNETGLIISAFGLALAALGMIASFVVFIWKFGGRWSQLAERMEEHGRAIESLARQAQDDRRATDRRLRWLEEREWRNGSNGSPSPVPGTN